MSGSSKVELSEKTALRSGAWMPQESQSSG
jgi:hypothetical protein